MNVSGLLLEEDISAHESTTKHNIMKSKAMSNQEAESFIKTLDEGLAEAEQQMLRDKASRNEPLIYADNNGNIKRVSAKDVLD